MEIAKFWGSEPQNPQTDWQKIWRGWLHRWWLPACKNSKQRPIWDVAAYAWSITLTWFL